MLLHAKINSRHLITEMSMEMKIWGNYGQGIENLLFQYILFAEGNVGAVFHLEEHGVRFQDFKGVPLAGGEMDAVFLLFGVDDGFSG